MTRLVSSAVDNLRPENVSVVDAGGQMLSVGSERVGGGRSFAEPDAALAAKLVATLEPVVGRDRVKANVTVEYDLGSSENTQEVSDPNAAAVPSSQVSEERLGGEAPAGVPGTPSKVPGAQPTGTPAPGEASPKESQVQRTESKTFAVSKTLRHTVSPPGGIKRLAAAVLIDDAVEVKEENGQRVESRRKRTPEEMKQIRDLAAATIGYDEARGDRLAIETLPFEVEPVQEPAPPTLAERVLPIVDRWIGVVRYVALTLLFLIIYKAVLGPIKKQIVTAFREFPTRVVAGAQAMPAMAAGAGPQALPTEGQLEMESALQQELAETSSEVKRAVMLKRHLADKVKKEPTASSRLIQSWIRQTKAGR